MRTPPSIPACATDPQRLHSALQGSFAEHVGVIKILAPSFLPTILTASAVRTPEQLALCQGLIIPGGESSAISLIIQSSRLLEPLREFVQRAKHGQGAVWGTCAGMILLASDVVGSLEGYEGLNGFDIKVVRNQFGRQVRCDSSRDPGSCSGWYHA